MGILLAAILLLVPPTAGAETIGVSITVAPTPAPGLPAVAGIEAGLARLFADRYARFAALSFDDAPGATGAPTRTPGPVAAIGLAQRGARVTVSTDLTRGGATRSLVSTVPAGAPASLLATMAGDLVFLLASSRDFYGLPLSPPPALAAILPTDALQVLTGWEAAALEPIGIAQEGDEIAVCFPHGYLSLGPLFRITADTVRDLNAQGTVEPLTLSGIAAGPGGSLFLLSPLGAAVARVNPRLGTRQVIPVPGLSARGSRALDGDTLAVLSDAAPGVSVHSFAGTARATIPVAASYVSAFGLDSEGNLWAWDAAERRIRVVAPDGREISSIRPLFRASTMELPQELETFDDGSFLLGGSGEVWKFESTGIPVWRLSRIPGRPGEQLPPQFALAANRTDGSFTLLDAPSRRLLAFAGSPSAESSPLSALLARLDSRKPADIKEAVDLARDSGLSLVAWQFADLLARRGGAEAGRSTARAAVLSEKARLYGLLADATAADLLYDQADRAYLGASAAARQVTAEDPGDADAAALLRTALSRRQEVGAALKRPSIVQVLSVNAVVTRGAACSPLLDVSVRLRNTGNDPLTRVRVKLSLPTISSTPSLAEADAMAGGSEEELQLQLASGDTVTGSGRAPDTVPAFALVSYEQSPGAGGGTEGVSSALSLSASITEEDWSHRLADDLACRVQPGDPLLAGLAGVLLSPDTQTSDPLVTLAGILDALGAMRTDSAAADEGSRAVTAGASGPALRWTLRGLSPDERAWTLLALSLGAHRGLPVGLMAWEDRAFALIDTGIPIAEAVALVPGLARYSDLLAALSRDGGLCVPLSGATAPRGSALGWAIADALREAGKRGLDAAVIAWRGGEMPRGTVAGQPENGAATPPVPVPFGLSFPTVLYRATSESLRAGMAAALTLPAF